MRRWRKLKTASKSSSGIFIRVEEKLRRGKYQIVPLLNGLFTDTAINNMQSFSNTAIFAIIDDGASPTL